MERMRKKERDRPGARIQAASSRADTGSRKKKIYRYILSYIYLRGCPKVKHR